MEKNHDRSQAPDFFVGTASAEGLAADLEGTRTVGIDTSRHAIESLEDGEFAVLPVHLVRVCDAFLEEKLTAEHLRIIGFCLMSSDYFFWDGYSPEQESVSRVASDWATPEVNFPIVRENVEKWRRLLLGERHAFSSLRPVR